MLRAVVVESCCLDGPRRRVVCPIVPEDCACIALEIGFPAAFAYHSVRSAGESRSILVTRDCQ